MKRKILSYTLMVISAIAIVGMTGCQKNLGNDKTFSEVVSENTNSRETSTNLSDETIVDESELSTLDKGLVATAKSLCGVGFVLAEPITEENKSAFFKWVISTQEYSDKVGLWWNDENKTYAIPLNEIKDIVSAHLVTDTFDPLLGFEKYDKQSKQGYNPLTETYYTKMIGGYGGAEALEVLSFLKKDNTVSITIGSYNLDDYYDDVRVRNLIKTYNIVFELDTVNIGKYKVMKCE